MLSRGAAAAFYGWPRISAYASHKDETSACVAVCVRVRCVYACVWFSITILTLPVSCFPHSVALYNNGWSATTTNGYDQLIHYLITLTNCRLISNKAPNSCTLYYLYSLFNIVPLLSALWFYNCSFCVFCWRVSLEIKVKEGGCQCWTDNEIKFWFWAVQVNSTWQILTLFYWIYVT